MWRFQKGTRVTTEVTRILKRTTVGWERQPRRGKQSTKRHTPGRLKLFVTDSTPEPSSMHGMTIQVLVKGRHDIQIGGVGNWNNLINPFQEEL